MPAVEAVRMDRDDRPSAAALLAELGYEPKLTIYLGSAPGAGKTHRILSDARFAREAGRRVAIGWVETKGRPDLDALIVDLPRIPPRRFEHGGVIYEDFDLEAALASEYETIVLDELAHANPPGAPHPKRWQDALALRAAGKSVLGAFNVHHLESVAPIAERIIGHPIREIVPLAFIRAADGVIALDVSPAVLESRLRSGRIVRVDDVERAAMGLFKPQNLQLLRELLLRTVDELTVPVTSPAKTSTALAIVTAGVEARRYLRRVGVLAHALDLALETTAVGPAADAEIGAASLAADGVAIVAPANLSRRLLNGELDRDAVLRRRPAVVLIDELAHTNEAGSTYPKRFDDVIALLREGISVITTLNVQHLAGLSDAVERLTGLHVRETLPDTILELADEVIFIDVTPDVLRDRLRRGKIYPKERADAALANFFFAWRIWRRYAS